MIEAINDHLAFPQKGFMKRHRNQTMLEGK
jgi:hypothetical protein